MVAILQRCEGLFASAPSSARKEYYQTTQELLFLNEIQCVWNGDVTTHPKHPAHSSPADILSVKETRGLSSERVDKGGKKEESSRDGRDGKSNGDSSDKTVSACLDDGLSADCDNADTRAVWRFIKLSRCLLTADLTLSERREAGRADYESSAEAIIGAVPTSSVSPTPPSSSSSSSSTSIPSHASTTTSTTSPSDMFSLPLSGSLKSWIALLTAKTLLCTLGDHQGAYHWVRRALAFAAPRPLPGALPRAHPVVADGTMKSCAGITRGSMSVDRCLPRLEVRGK